MERSKTVVVGAGPAGLAVASCLKKRGVPAVILEKGDTVAPAWHSHYERLHLHTNKAASGLPGIPMPADYPRYPSRDQVAEYMTGYARVADLDVRLGTDVGSVTRCNGSWQVETSGGDVFETDCVVIATGLSHTPRTPSYEGQAGFHGQILHSAHYLNGERYRGRRVLVVGFGNSAGEIALDLMEHGASAFLSVRSPSVVVPRDVLGIPILTVARLLSIFPPKVADALSKPLLRVLVGDVSKVGIPAADWGPIEQIATSGKIPLLDIGTVAALKRGDIEARPGIDRFTETGVIFSDGREEAFDAVVFATGYEAALDRVLASTEGLVDERGVPLVSGGETSEAGLYFCGFREPPTGRLREIGLEAERIAELIAARVGSPTAAS
jgi:cation diffusion facilitator CzcD-associated flavoprotein CzcO